MVSRETTRIGFISLFILCVAASFSFAGGGSAAMTSSNGTDQSLFTAAELESFKSDAHGSDHAGVLSGGITLSEPSSTDGIFYLLLALSVVGIICVIFWYKLGFLERMPVSIRLYIGLGIILSITLAIGLESVIFQSKLAHHSELVRLGTLAEFSIEKAARYENEFIVNVHKHPERAGTYEQAFEAELEHMAEYLQEMSDLDSTGKINDAISSISSAKVQYGEIFVSLTHALHEIDTLRVQNRVLSEELLHDIETLIEAETASHDRLIDEGAPAEKVLEYAELIAALEKIEIYWVRTINEQSNFMLDIDLAHVEEVQHDLSEMSKAIAATEAFLGHFDQDTHDVDVISSVLELARKDAALVGNGFKTIVIDEFEIESLLAQSHDILESTEHALEQLNAFNYENEQLAHAGAKKVSYLLITMGLITGMMVGLVMSTSIILPIRVLLASLNRLVEGDLTQKIDEKRSDEFGQLFNAYNSACEQLSVIITEVKSNAFEIAESSAQIDERTNLIAQGMDSQRSQTGQVSAAVEELSASVTEVAQNSQSAAELSKAAGEKAVQGGSIVERTIEGMNAIGGQVLESVSLVGELHKQSEQIGQVISVINDIADQTNLLALNAAIEAARAGEHGRGFAVVADEVRKLAERTTQATEQVRESIHAMQFNTETAAQSMQSGRELAGEGQEFASQAGESLGEIVRSSNEVAPVIAEIAAAANEQSGAANEIASSVEMIDSVSREAADGIREVAQSSNDLSEKSQDLRELVERFKV
jgi:methyl-accepting chemotaxis protein